MWEISFEINDIVKVKPKPKTTLYIIHLEINIFKNSNMIDEVCCVDLQKSQQNIAIA